MDLDPSSTIIFLHIPKAAGSTLHTIIDRQYNSATIFTTDGANVRESLAAFKQIPLEKKAEYRIVKGHMSFGLHRWLPQSSTYITFLRDPIERVISHYYYVLAHPNHYLHQQVMANNMGLKEYVASGISVELNNGQTRLLAGIEESDAVHGFGPCSEKMLESAKHNLENYFAVVGLSEFFDESLLLMKQTFNWSNVFYARQNVTRQKRQRSEIDQKTLDVIRNHNLLDIELFQYSQQRLQKQIGPQGSAFQKELKRFRLLNKPYDRCVRLFKPIIRRLNHLLTHE